MTDSNDSDMTPGNDIAPAKQNDAEVPRLADKPSRSSELTRALNNVSTTDAQPVSAAPDQPADHGATQPESQPATDAANLGARQARSQHDTGEQLVRYGCVGIWEAAL